jgi:hypothetical protein
VIETHGVQVRFDIDGAAQPLVVGDPARLLQAITTLIDHAARSTGQGGDIAVTARVTSGEVVIRVADTGRGIAPDRMPRLFEVCGEDTPPPGSGALNLGFTLVKRLIELHDGAMRAWSEGVGKGTTFEVRLPLAPQDVELPDVAAQDPEASCPDTLTEPTIRMQALDGGGQSTSLSSEDLAARTYPGDAIARRSPSPGAPRITRASSIWRIVRASSSNWYGFSSTRSSGPRASERARRSAL